MGQNNCAFKNWRRYFAFEEAHMLLAWASGAELVQLDFFFFFLNHCWTRKTTTETMDIYQAAALGMPNFMSVPPLSIPEHLADVQGEDKSAGHLDPPLGCSVLLQTVSAVLS